MTLIQKISQINDHKYLEAYKKKSEKVRAKFRFVWAATVGANFPVDETSDFIIRDYLIKEEIDFVERLYKEMFQGE